MERNTTRTWIAPNGNMHRDDNYSKPFRPFAAWPWDGIKTTHDLKAAIRAGRMAFGGCSPYFLTSDGAALCERCTCDNIAAIFDSIATRTNDGWRVTGCDMDNNAENTQCDHCGTAIGYQDDETTND
jgi:hypothetical protein